MLNKRCEDGGSWYHLCIRCLQYDSGADKFTVCCNAPTVRYNVALHWTAITRRDADCCRMRNTVWVWDQAGKKRGFLKKVFRFYRLLGFFVQRLNTTVPPKSTRERVTLAVNGLSKLLILLKTNLQWAKENRTPPCEKMKIKLMNRTNHN